MYRPQIIVNVRGGIIQDNFASDPDIDVILVDWDVNAGEQDAIAVPLPAGPKPAIVAHPNIQPLHLLAGSDVEAAIETACACGLTV